MPNYFAYLVLYSYPLVVLVMFRRLPRHTALIWSIMAGYLFLPEQTGIDLPLLPELNKVLIPSLSAALMCLALPDAAQPRARRGTARAEISDQPPRKQSLLVNLCLLAIFLAPIAIYLTNRAPVIVGPKFIAGLRPYDIFSMMLNAGVALLPFLLARRYLATREAQVALLRAFVIGALIYSVIILIEVRLSPQINRWIYGFTAHSFAQHMRAGGFRPMGFLEHGLRIGIFLTMAIIAALTLYRAKLPLQESREARRRSMPQNTGRFLAIAFYLLVVLYLSKTLGAFLIALVLIPLAWKLRPRTQFLCAAGVAGLVLLYPMMRAADLVPVDQVYRLALSIDADRASSFKFRLDNEDQLLDRAGEKPIAGWGGWGRSRIFDPRTGRDLSVTDGIWVIAFGQGGWLGYFTRFSLLTFPIFFLVRRGLNDDTAILTAGLSVILAANLIDLIPNSALTPLTWMLAGTLLAAVERPQAFERKTDRTDRHALRRRPRSSQVPLPAQRQRAGPVN